MFFLGVNPGLPMQSINRREIFVLLGSALVSQPVATFAQARSTPLVGWLSPTTAASDTDMTKAFVQGLHEQGYDEGGNVVIEYRYADEHFERLPELAEELVRLRSDVIVARVTAASLAAKKATSTTAIVMNGTADPVGAGLVASLARPGGNATGTSSISDQLAGKALELLRDAVPDLHRVAVLWNPANAVFQARMLELTKAAGNSLAIELQVLAVSNSDELDEAFRAMDRERAQALDLLADPTLLSHQGRIISLATSARLPSVTGVRGYADAGGLMSYGPSFTALSRRTAFYVARILKGTAPADLPVEQPTTFELVVTQRAAKALGLTLPFALLIRADEVLE
jgi:putative ABC transport system substrate-binding protein